MVEKSDLGMILLMFIGVIIAMAILPSIAENTNEMTNTFSMTNESINLALARTMGDGLTINASKEYTIAKSYDADDWRVSKCPFAGVAVRNQTGGTLTLNTDYTFNTAYGNFTFLDTGAVNDSTANATAIDYTYCDTGYVTDSAGRAIVKLILIFAALAILGFSVWFILKKLDFM